MARLHIVPFSTVDKWYVSYYLNPYRVKSSYTMVNLSNVISPIKIKVKKNDYQGGTPVVSKISFSDGKIHIRAESKTGMDLYKLFKNNLLVSKINFHQGALAISKESELVCSTHYQPYEIDFNKVNGEFLTLAIRSNAFKDHLQYLRADGIKNEATYEFIGKLQIPLPLLAEQNRMVAACNAKIALAEQQEIQAKQLEQGIDLYLFDVLGINQLEENQAKRFRTISFVDVDRWSVDSLGATLKVEEKFKGNFPLVKFRSMILSYQYGLSAKSSASIIGVPMLRMNNIKNSVLDFSSLKYIDIDQKTFIKSKLNKGDLLFNRTNSKELVGKTALFELDENFTFASYLIRVVINPSKANSEFVNFLFNSPILQYQKNLVSRQITGQANINAQEMQEFLFPLPPLAKQQEIAQHIANLKSQIKHLKIQAEQNRAGAIKAFEQAIFNH